MVNVVAPKSSSGSGRGARKKPEEPTPVERVNTAEPGKPLTKVAGAQTGSSTRRAQEHFAAIFEQNNARKRALESQVASDTSGQEEDEEERRKRAEKITGEILSNRQGLLGKKTIAGLPDEPTFGSAISDDLSVGPLSLLGSIPGVGPAPASGIPTPAGIIKGFAASGGVVQNAAEIFLTGKTIIGKEAPKINTARGVLNNGLKAANNDIQNYRAGLTDYNEAQEGINQAVEYFGNLRASTKGLTQLNIRRLATDDIDLLQRIDAAEEAIGILQTELNIARQARAVAEAQAQVGLIARQKSIGESQVLSRQAEQLNQPEHEPDSDKCGESIL